MDIDDLTDADRKALAADVAAELDTGHYGSRFVLSRRQLLSLAGGSAGVAGLVALGVDPATAQSAAGQVGTQSSPEDVFAFNLDVQGALQRDLDAGGQAISNVGSVSTDQLTTKLTRGQAISRSYDSFYQNQTGNDILITVILENQQAASARFQVFFFTSPQETSLFPDDIAHVVDAVKASGTRSAFSVRVPESHYYYIDSRGSNEITLETVIRREFSDSA